MTGKKMGRPPSENPKSVSIHVRLTAEEVKLLDEYCEKSGISRPQGLRDGIYALREKP